MYRMINLATMNLPYTFRRAPKCYVTKNRFGKPKIPNSKEAVIWTLLQTFIQFMAHLKEETEVQIH